MGARYRKYNDRTQNSSTYHKKDGTAPRSKLKKEISNEIDSSLFPPSESAGIPAEEKERNKKVGEQLQKYLDS